MTPLIRRACPEDAPALEELERECFPDPNWDAQEFLRYTCTVAEIEGRIAGFIVVRDVFPGLYGQPPQREILNIAVLPVYRRLGIAKALLKQELLPGAEHFLEVRESNQAARQLYEAMGFKEIGTRKNYYDNPVETAIVMHMK